MLRHHVAGNPLHRTSSLNRQCTALVWNGVRPQRTRFACTADSGRRQATGLGHGRRPDLRFGVRSYSENRTHAPGAHPRSTQTRARPGNRPTNCSTPFRIPQHPFSSATKAGAKPPWQTKECIVPQGTMHALAVDPMHDGRAPHRRSCAPIHEKYPISDEIRTLIQGKQVMCLCSCSCVLLPLLLPVPVPAPVPVIVCWPVHGFDLLLRIGLQGTPESSAPLFPPEHCSSRGSPPTAIRS